MTKLVDIVFIVPSYKPELGQESMGTLILAKILMNAGFTVKVLRFWEFDEEFINYNQFKEKCVSKITSLSPRIVCFYCRCAEYHIIVDIAKTIKHCIDNINVVFGGPHADLVAKETLHSFPFVDYICCGEGEKTIIPTASFILNKDSHGEHLNKIPGLAYRAPNGLIQINDRPELLPDNYKSNSFYYDLIPDKLFCSSVFVSIDVGRGCPFSCAFCTTKTFWQQKFRLRDISNTLDEIEYVTKKYKINNFSFSHDLFTASKRRVLQFCTAIQERGLNIKWSCSSRVDTMDYEMLDQMVKSGLTGIYYGIETGSKRMQKLVNKNLDLSKCIKIVNYTLKKNVHVSASFIYGFPEEKDRDIEETLEIVEELKACGVQNIQFHLLSFDKGSSLYEKYKDKLFLSNFISNTNTTFGLEYLYGLIKDNPTIFSSFYDYSSPLRNEMKYIEIYFMVRSSLPDTFKTVFTILKDHKHGLLDIYRLFCNSCHNMLQKTLSHEARMRHVSFPVCALLTELFLSSMNSDKNKSIMLNKEERKRIWNSFYAEISAHKEVKQIIAKKT